MSILFLKPIFKERIWGSTYFKNNLKYPLDDNLYGELWSVSAHPEGLVEIINGKFKGLTLKTCYENNRELFGTKDLEFPLMVKLISASTDLSIQVHPDDEYALKNEKQLGKSECWYFLNSKDSSVIVGHQAKCIEELKKALKNKTILNLLTEKAVKEDDFVLIKAGTIHALKAGSLVLEIQQSSDVTYRLYDYDRTDKNGQLRPLHQEKAFDVINQSISDTPLHNYQEVDFGLTKILNYEKFSVELLNIDRFYEYEIKNNKFVIFSVIKGMIMVDKQQIKIGESFIVLNDETKVLILGTGRLLVTYL